MILYNQRFNPIDANRFKRTELLILKECSDNNNNNDNNSDNNSNDLNIINSNDNYDNVKLFLFNEFNIREICLFL